MYTYIIECTRTYKSFILLKAWQTISWNVIANSTKQERQHGSERRSIFQNWKPRLPFSVLRTKHCEHLYGKSLVILICVKKIHVFTSLSCLCDSFSIKWHYLCTRKGKIVKKDNVEQRLKGSLKKRTKTMITTMVLLVVGVMIAQAIRVNNKMEMGK